MDRPMDMRHHAVVFDMDGVILDSERIIRDGWIAAAAARGHALPDELFHRVIGNNSAASNAIVREMLGDGFPLAEVFADARERIEHATRDGWPLKPYARELIEALAAAGVPLAVASSTRREQVLARLESAGVGRWFGAVCGGDEVTHGKPHPEIYLAAAARIAADPLRCIAIEDSLHGARAAAAAQMHVLLVPDLVPPPDPLPGHVDDCFPSLAAGAARVFALLDRPHPR